MFEMTEQKLLPFATRLGPKKKQLVKLNSFDTAERQRCVDNDLEFPPSMLEETRCQRMGVSRGFFAGMFVSDRNRELADEECILRSDNWQFVECTWIDWKRHEATGKAVAAMFQSELVSLVESKMRQMG